MNQLFRRKQYSESDQSSGLLRVLGVWDIVFSEPVDGFDDTVDCGC